MGYRTHWTSVSSLSVETKFPEEIPGAMVDEETGHDTVLVLFDHGNQEGLVLEGGPAEWRHLAELITLRAERFEMGLL